MKDWREVLIKKDVTIHEAINKIDSASLQIALVVDEENKLLGTVTDGDIRRGLEKGDNNIFKSSGLIFINIFNNRKCLLGNCFRFILMGCFFFSCIVIFTD